jgi:hypothetical protein
MIGDRALLWVHLALCAWFALNFVGVPRLVARETPLGLAGALLAGVLAVAIAYGLGVERAAFGALPILLYWCWNQRRHWLFHFGGAPPAIIAKYDALFGGNVRLLPLEQGRVVPDAYHTILHLLLVADTLLTIRACLRLLG